MSTARLLLAASLVIAPALAPRIARGDAVLRTQAMFASTIVEYFVEAEAVRVDLEIGTGDLRAFANLLPDAVHRELGLPAQPHTDRLVRFFAHDLAVAADGEILAGRLLGLEPRERPRRDPITGEALQRAEGDEPEIVLFASLVYPFSGRPQTITLFGSLAQEASLGFVTYHGAVAVNDFRYLGSAQTLRLDWQDPFYTRFESRALRRQYFAPMSGFLYVDPYEVRKEIIVRPLDLQRFVDLGLEGRTTIPVEIQPELERRAADFLREHHPVEIDGVRVEGELARINFLERTLRTSRVVEPRQELDIYAAVLGAIFVYPTEGLPERVTMEWDLWTERTPLIPAASVDQAGPLPILLEPDFRVLEWRNFLKNPELPTFHVLSTPPSGARRAMASWGRWVFLTLAISFALAAARSRSRPAFFSAGLAVALAVTGFAWSRDANLSDERAGEIVGGLLHNVYRAFDFRDEERIYDLLAHSAEGDLLERVYLETRRGLELQNQGGARARVKQVEVVDLAVEPAGAGAFDALTTWNVAGSVGHWGHIHQRRNRYRAKLRVAPVDGAWKLVDLEILEEERL